MRWIGIDLHKRFMVVAVEDEMGSAGKPQRFECNEQERIVEFFHGVQPFQAVIEASSSYRWLYDLLSPLGEVILAHPYKLRAITSGRAKTDKIDAALLASLLRAKLIPRAYVPPKPYQELRELTRARARLSRHATEAKNEIRAILRRRNAAAPYTNIFCKGGMRWLQELDCGGADNWVRDELLRRIEHYERELLRLDQALAEQAGHFPEVEALKGLYGLGLYSALLIIAEIGEPQRFPDGRRVGSYAGLTARVSQSGSRAYYGHITRQGSSWLRWILVQVAMKLVRKDRQLGNFYTRIRKRSSAKIAQVAAARKLAAICWVRLVRWHREHAA